MFGLVDCNNFYVSCERVFNPRLDWRPVVVLSNNDGCVISRSAEAKALGIPMGEPYFETRRRAGVGDVVALNSNYALYGDMSDRVMTVLAELVPAVEVYSIDEAFLDLRGLAREARALVGQWTGIPVGVAPTKTLANRLAKRDPAGVWLLDSEAARRTALEQVEVGDVWGVGGRYAAKLRAEGIGTAAELAAVPLGWARKELGGVVGERPIGEALAAFVSWAAEKLRAEELVAGTLKVLLHTSRFAGESAGAGHQATVTLGLPNPRPGGAGGRSPARPEAAVATGAALRENGRAAHRAAAGGNGAVGAVWGGGPCPTRSSVARPGGWRCWGRWMPQDNTRQNKNETALAPEGRGGAQLQRIYSRGAVPPCGLFAGLWPTTPIGALLRIRHRLGAGYVGTAGETPANTYTRGRRPA